MSDIDNSIYEPVEPNVYNYAGLHKLKYDAHKILMEQKINKINICCYQVNNTQMYPFIQFLLHKNFMNDVLEFPFIYMPQKYDSTPDMVTNIQHYINNLLGSQFITKNNKEAEYKGSYYYKKNIYLFFDLSKCEIIINDVYKINNTWFGLMHEIINETHLCNLIIHPETTMFFINNEDFIFLKDANNKNYEIPMVAYAGTEISKLTFTHVFGVPKPNIASFMGPYYYFTDFKNAIRQGGWDEKTKKRVKGGIVRFALFTNLIKIKFNCSEDNIDESDIKKNLITNTNNLNEILTLRISDYDGKWAKTYDSVYIGNIELDNGEQLPNTPIYVVKNYEQQIPLSYHYIDTQFLGEVFDPKMDYLIM
jgi:hypothetical protein